ncbi:MAG: YeeE/YedE family protein [Burkholderiales bacterium]
MTIAPFEIIQPLAGGALIGLAAAGLWFSLGRIAGVSNILGGTLSGGTDFAWRLAFLAGLFLAGAATFVWAPNHIRFDLPVGWMQVCVAGFLVGFGTLLGGGCTSGHGVCGVARISPRSLVATGLFMANGAAAVYVWRHLL